MRIMIKETGEIVDCRRILRYGTAVFYKDDLVMYLSYTEYNILFDAWIPNENVIPTMGKETANAINVFGVDAVIEMQAKIAWSTTRFLNKIMAP